MSNPKLKPKDNFDILIEFLKDYYKLTAAEEIFATMQADEIGAMMLLKRDLSQSELFFKYLFKDIKFDD